MYPVKIPSPPAHVPLFSITARASIKLLMVCLVLASVPIALYVRVNSQNSKAAVIVQAAGRGQGLLNPQDGRELKVEYSGDTTMSEALRTGLARPLALATADFDRDGAPDLVTGYSYFGAGILTLQRGNVDAFVPKDLKIYERAAKGQLPPSFLTETNAIQLPEASDFLLVGDFNDDGNKDLLTAARGGGLYLLQGDGRGGFDAPEALQLPGPVTALTTGTFGHAEGWQAVIAGVVGPQGPALAIFSHDTSNGLSRTAKISALPSEATALVLGSFDDDPYFDLGVAAGQEIVIVHGQKPAAPISDGQVIDLQSRMEHINLGFNGRGLAAGTFIPDGIWGMDLAALSSDGTIHLLQRSKTNAPAPINAATQFAGLSPHEIRVEIRKQFVDEVKASAKVPMWQPGGKQDWTDVRQFGQIAPPAADAPQALLTTGNVSARRADDLLLLDAGNRQVQVLIEATSNQALPAANTSAPASSRVPVSFDVASAPVAVLQMPQKINGERDLVVLSAAQPNPVVVPLAVTAIFNVTKTTDTNDGLCNADCSLREAVLASNATAGANTINVPAGTYNLSTTNPAPSATTGTGNFTSQDLQVGSATNNNATIVGTGVAPNIHLNTGTQDVITTGFNTAGTSPVAVTLSLQNLEVTGGTFTGIFTGVDNASGISSTTITNCNIHNNTNGDATFGQGGGHQNQCGNLSISGTTYATNTATHSVRGQGGALYYAVINATGLCSTGNLSITTSTFTSNTASVQAGFPAGGAMFISGPGATTVPISASTFTSNNANGGGDGGAIASNFSTRTVNVTTSTFITNQVSNAAGRGGAIVGNGAGTLNVNFCRFIGNTATTVTNGRTLARTGGTFNGTSNWWGQNTGPAANDIFGAVTTSPHLQLRSVISGANVHNTNQIAPVNGNTAIFTADILGLSTGGSTAAANLVGLATFPAAPFSIYSNGSPALGSITTPSGQYVNGVANVSTTFTANGTKGIATVNATADGFTAGTQLLIGFTPVFTNQAGSDATPFASAACGGGANVPCYATMGAALTNVALTDLLLAPGVINIQTGGYAESPNFNQGSTVNVTATITNTGSFTFTNGIINANANGISLTGDWTNNGSVFNQGTSTVTFNGGTAQAINGSAVTQTFHNLTVNKGGGTLSVGLSTTTLNINGNLLISAGTFSAGTAAAINVGGNWTNNVGPAAFTPGSGTVTFNSTTATQTINGTAASQTFNNLTVSKSGQVLNTGGSTTQLDLNGNFSLSAGTFTAPATINVAGDWTQTSGTTFTPGSGTVNFNGSGARNLNGTAAAQTFNNLTISKTGGGSVTGGGNLATLTLNGAMTLASGTFSTNTITAINLAGNWINNGGTFTPGTSNVTFNSTTATQSITGTAASQTFFTITMNKTGQTLNTAGSTTTLDINGNLVLTAGTFTAPATMTIAGNFTQATGTTFTPGAGTVTFDGGGAQSIDGTLATKTFNNFTVNKTGTLSGVAGTTALDINGNLTITAGTFAAGTATSITVFGNWANTGTFTGGAGTVTFDGVGNTQTLSGTTTFNNLTINHTAPGNVDASGSTLTVTGLLRIQGGTFIVAGNTFNNVQIDSGQTLQGTNGTTMSVSGNWTNNGGTFTPSGNTVNFNGAGAQSISGTSTTQTFDNFTVNKSGGTLSVAANTTALDINGNVTLTLGTFAAGTATTITVAGNWINNGGAFTAGTGTVSFDGAAPQTIGGTTATTFNNLTIANATGVSLTQSETVNGLLTLTNDLTTGANTLNMPAAATSGPATNAADVIGNVKRTGFVAAGSALSFGNPFNTIRINSGAVPIDINVNLVKSAPAGFSSAVQRTYTITPNGAHGPVTLRLHYLDSELNGNLPETSLNLRRFNGTGWQPFVATSSNTADALNNWLENNAVPTLSAWTFSTFTPTASNGVISGRITTSDGTPVEGAVVRLSGTQDRKFITDTNGFYRFDNVETDGFYTVTPSRVNYTFNPSARSFSQLGQTTDATFGATLASGGFGNPLDTPEYFVRQHYLDFLAREPDENGFNFWSDQVLSCGNDAGCIERRRINVSAAYFLSIESQETGGLVDGLYRVSYGRRPLYAEFVPDRGILARNVIVGRSGWEQLLEANKQSFINAFVQRPSFVTTYGSLANDSYVDELIRHTGVSFTTAERDALVNGLTSGTATRAGVLRQIVENQRFAAAKFSEAFVMMEYFGYLRRDPDDDGYQFWLRKLNQFNGNFEQAEMVKAFIVSGEFRDRFPR